jgi:hypothetical protein
MEEKSIVLSKGHFYNFILNRAREIEANTKIEELKLFIASLQETFLKVEVDCSVEKKCFNFLINGKLFSTVIDKKIHDYYDDPFHEFVKQLSFTMVDPVTEYCDELNLQLISDPYMIISPSYYIAHFLASLAGYKFI